MTEAELPQKRPESRWRITGIEDSAHPTVPQDRHVVDVLSAPATIPATSEVVGPSTLAFAPLFRRHRQELIHQPPADPTRSACPLGRALRDSRGRTSRRRVTWIAESALRGWGSPSLKDANIRRRPAEGPPPSLPPVISPRSSARGSISLQLDQRNGFYETHLLRHLVNRRKVGVGQAEATSAAELDRFPGSAAHWRSRWWWCINRRAPCAWTTSPTPRPAKRVSGGRCVGRAPRDQLRFDYFGCSGRGN